MNSHIDMNVLEDLFEAVGSDMVFLNELIDEYFQDVPRLVDHMWQALDAGDLELLRRSAHSLKTTSGSFGAKPLAALCKQVEDMGKTGETGAAQHLINEISAEYEFVSRELDRIRNEG